MPSETKTENKKIVASRLFRGGIFVPWEQLCAEAAEFASEIGLERLITISHSEDKNVGVVVVWYWIDQKESESANLS